MFNCKTKKDVRKIVKEQNISFGQFRFTDVLGVPKIHIFTKRLGVIVTIVTLIATFAVFTESGNSAPSTTQTSKPKLEKTQTSIALAAADIGLITVYVALEYNLFADEGLKVTLNQFNNGTDATRALISNSVEILGAGFPEVVMARANGADVKMFYGLCNGMAYQWFAKKDIKTNADVKGKKVAISKIGTLSDELTRYVVKQAGLDPEKDVQIVQAGDPGSRLAALQSGAVDLACLTPPGTYVAAKQGFNAVLSVGMDQSNFPYYVYSASPKFLKDNPETIKAFLRANNKAIQIVKTDDAKTIAVIEKYIKFTGDVAKQALAQFKNWFPDDGTPPLDGMNMMQDILLQGGNIKQKLLIADVLDTTYINAFKKK